MGEIPKENIDINSILSAGFIYSYPNCDNQLFHYDYANKTKTYFIPLSDLTDLNGTEYLSFYDTENNEKYLNLLTKINNKFLLKDDVIKYLTENNVKKSEYEIKIYNSNAYSLYKLPNNILHRGKTNETNDVRILFQLVVTNDNTYFKNMLIDEIIFDAELDDNTSNKFYLLKFNDKFLSISKRGKNYSYGEIEYHNTIHYNKIDTFKWFMKIIDNDIYIYHKSGLLLIVNNDNVNEPFHFSIEFLQKYNWHLLSNEYLSFSEKIKIKLIET